MISDLQLHSISKGYFLLLKAVDESIKISAVALPVEDGHGRVTNLGIYNAKYNYIPKD